MNRKWKSFQRVALLGVVLALSACGKDEVQDPGLQPGAQGEVEFTTLTEPIRLKLAVKAGQLYRFVCKPATLTGCQLQLRDATSLEPLGEARSTNVNEKWGITLFWTASANGPVVMDLQAAGGGGSSMAGQFSYQFTEAADDAGSSLDEAVKQPVTQTETSFEGFLETSGDVDAWRFSVPANHNLRARCRAAEAGSHPDMELFLPDGTSLGTYNYGAYPFDDLPYIAVKNVGGGDILLRVQANARQPSTFSHRYECTVSDAGPDDHGDVAAEATVVTVPAQVDVAFGARNDVDMLATDLIEGHVYLLKDATAGIPSGKASVYCGTTVTDAQGTQQGPKLVTYGDGARFTAPTSGRYFLALERTFSDGYWGNWGSPTSHRFEITDVTEATP
ncbi:PPC domain-containing protein [Corallococcus sp. M7]